ncbi:hypothetical protein D3C72_1982090 [compost metagenome]
MAGLDGYGGGCDAGFIGNVQLYRRRHEALLRQIGDRRLATPGIARADDHGDTGLGKLAGDLKPDPLVGAGNEGDAPGVHG